MSFRTCFSLLTWARVLVPPKAAPSSSPGSGSSYRRLHTLPPSSQDAEKGHLDGQSRGFRSRLLRSTGREGRLCAQACPTSRLGRTTKGEPWDAPGPVCCVQIRIRPRCTRAVLASSSYSRCCPTSWNAISCSSTAPLFPDPTTQPPGPSWRRPF